MSDGLDCIVEKHRCLRFKKKNKVCYMVVERIIMRLAVWRWMIHLLYWEVALVPSKSDFYLKKLSISQDIWHLIQNLGYWVALGVIFIYLEFDENQIIRYSELISDICLDGSSYRKEKPISGKVNEEGVSDGGRNEPCEWLSFKE